jgi:hypothetical protein
LSSFSMWRSVPLSVRWDASGGAASIRRALRGVGAGGAC